MGTNYYAVRNRPTTEEPIHIGKSSMGWKFLFQEQCDEWHEPPIEWHSFEQVKEWLHDHTVKTQEYVILDEYDKVVAFGTLVAIVEFKQDKPNRKNINTFKDKEGYEFYKERFW